MDLKNDATQSIRQHKIHFYRQIAYTFIGAALVVLMGLIYFSLSQALIVVTPTLEEVSANFNVLVKADSNKTQENLTAQLYLTGVVSDRTGMGELLAEGDPQKASGMVILKNTSSKAQPLVATTRLLSEEGVLFRLKSAVTVPGGGEVKAKVFADVEGKGGEIGPTRFVIPGLNEARQQEVYAESVASMTGGTSAIYRVTEDAVDTAVDEAKDRILQAAREKLSEEGLDTESLLANVSVVEITKQTVTPEIGADAQEFTVSIEADVVFVSASQDELLKYSQKQLFATTSLGYELSSSDEGSFEYSLENFDVAKQSAQLRISLTGQKRISSSNPALDASNFVGQKPALVKTQLESNSGIESVSIELRPFWLRKIPRLVDHIYVQFAQ